VTEFRVQMVELGLESGNLFKQQIDGFAEFSRRDFGAAEALLEFDGLREMEDRQ
jgi:hypothetical protein